MSNSGQKFVARNRAPRVQIEYDVELYGAEKKVQLPFVMGVMADLTGKSEDALPSVNDRKFLEIDVDNFDERLKSLKPRAAFTVANTLTGEGNLSVDITFERLEDFSPAAIAQKIEPLRKLLDARTQLAHLSTYMDGKTGAENLIARLISDPAALSALTAVAPETGQVDTAAALAGLRAAADAAPAMDTPNDQTAVLEALRNRPEAPVRDDAQAEEAFAALRARAEAVSDLSATDEKAVAAVLADLHKVGDDLQASQTEADLDLAAILNADLAEPTEDSGDDSYAGVLDGLRQQTIDPDAEDDAKETALEGLRQAASALPEEEEEHFDLDALLAGAVEDEDENAPDIEFDDLLNPLDGADDDENDDEDLSLSFEDDSADDDSDDLAALLAGNESDSLETTAEGTPAETGITDADTDLDALLNGLVDELGQNEDEDQADDGEDDELDLGALLAGEGDTDLEALLGDLGGDAPETDADDLDLSSLLSEDDDTEFETLLPDGDDTGDEEPAIAAPFGTLSAARPDDRERPRDKFRIALLGDFSGRASRGELQIGDDLASRKPLKFDIDNFEDVIARFATTLVLPIGKDGAGVEVPLNSLDDLHPDELYENVALFDELSALRQRVARGEAAALGDLKAWAEETGATTGMVRSRAKGSAVPADRKLSDFQSLIGDMKGTLARPSPVDELIGSVVGPYVVAAADQKQDSLLAALDDALSGAMRSILHHPDFQAVESVWRSLEFLARRVETDASFEIVLYDVSAEEWAADLAAQEDLAESGLFRLLAEEPRLDAAQGPISAVFALYTLEETPPHAELLARMSKISEWMNAPFVTAISAHFLDTPKKDRHPLVAKAWDELRALPEAAYVGLAAPRFLLRLPYGARTEPVDPFEFEEFTLRSGLKGMLWANPVILSATLLAATAYKSGKSMRLGEILSLGDIPVHTMVDSYGDQVALPCTERLLNTRTTEEVTTRGFMPVLSIKGRNEIRQGSFQALGAGELHGPWDLTPGQGRATFGTEVALGKAPAASASTSVGEIEADGPGTSSSADADGGEVLDLDMELDLDLGSESDTDDSDTSLDDLLAGFGDEGASSDDDEMDPELAALLGDL
ncbi:type VI secretion system contractile sheath small subunit [Roseibium sp.]|uniref:type VI secretion system contractile sheath small subunit n=1 Tax=Roseibium sp. TaxID=1936156 RepID=UPI003A97A2AB